VRLTVIGAGPAYTDDPGSIGACYLVEEAGAAIVLDLGQGAFARLAARIEPSRVGAVLISHLHPDHFVDLVPLRHYLRYEFSPPRRVSVLAPRGLTDRLDGLHGEVGFASGVLDVAALASSGVEVGPFAIAVGRVAHTAESYAFRVATGPGPGLVYSGDVGVAADLRGLVRDGDVLLVEVSFGPGPVPAGAAHLDGPAVAALAAVTRPSSVLLTHLQMGFDPGATIESVRRGFEGPVRLVRPGDVITL
jgi:ribonuclease BN (tRNA processing enzyme)